MAGRFRSVGLATLAGVLLLVIALTGCGKGVTRDILNPEERRWLTENQGRIVLGVETNSAPLVFLDPQAPRAKLVETGDTSESYVGAGKEKG